MSLDCFSPSALIISISLKKGKKFRGRDHYIYPLTEIVAD